jgi:hypothetical protein
VYIYPHTYGDYYSKSGMRKIGRRGEGEVEGRRDNNGRMDK